MNIGRWLVTVLLLVAATGCTWVKLTDEGDAVNVLTSEAVADCRRLGTTTSISKDKVAGVNRSVRKLTAELEALARNRAPVMGGNTIVPAGELDGNQRTYDVFSCP